MSTPVDQARLQELTERIVAADFGSGGAEDLRALEEWLAANPEDSEQHLAIMAMWEELGELREPEAAAFAPPPQPAPRRFRLEGYRIAAAILPLFAVIGILLLTIGYGRGDGALELRTGPGERRIVTLADGSTVSLSPESHVRVDLQEEKRSLRLAGGEALFEVAHDPARPFVVSAGAGEVRAIGTAFNVRLTGPEVTVTVVEGTISVTAGQEKGQAAKAGLVQLAKAGEQVTYGGRARVQNALASDSFITPARRVEVARYAGWAKGMLRFDGEPLSEVVEEVNRYSLEQVRLHDDALGRMPIYGVLHVGDTEGLVSIVQDSQGLSDAALERKIQVVPRRSS